MKSVFDGWTKKIEFNAYDEEGGYCAVGWLNRHHRFNEYLEIRERIGSWIQKNLDPPSVYVNKFGLRQDPGTSPGMAIIWANNECKLDIEGFKMVDLLTQGYVPVDDEVINKAASAAAAKEEKVLQC